MFFLETMFDVIKLTGRGSHSYLSEVRFAVRNSERNRGIALNR
ncbi:hypothetical protein NIES2104_38840 [Leptolyngbya sp. NIES-2104]|nr:hypothetical protein NIES2104_38840 [Leptolyngbya sp. NIES-2104]